MKKLTKEEFEKYIKDAAEYKFCPNPAFITEEFYKANKEYFDEIGVVHVFEGEPITEEQVEKTLAMIGQYAYVFPQNPNEPVEIKINTTFMNDFDIEKFERDLLEALDNGK